MRTPRSFVPAATALLALALLNGCGLVSSLPGFGGGSAPIAVDPGDPGVKPGPPGIGVGPPLQPIQVPDNPTLVVVHPGAVDQATLRDVAAVELRSAIMPTGHLVVRVRWWGGIEPCELLDSVAVDRVATTITLAARVGSAAGGQVACIDIARDTATLVDLGVLEPGSYTIRALAGDARPLVVNIPDPSPGPS
jgi:hypothetical protein